LPLQTRQLPNSQPPPAAEWARRAYQKIQPPLQCDDLSRVMLAERVRHRNVGRSGSLATI
jgi:hypothetical protein